MVLSARRALRCQPSSPCPAVEAIVVELEVDPAAKRLAVRYEVVAPVDRLRVPSDALDPDRLWAHTCAELFVAGASGEAYVEYNFSPTGQTASFSFSSYRERAASPPRPARLETTREPGRLRLDAEVPWPLEIGDGARFGVTAVIETRDGELSYWALAHPRARPDFHDAAGFALKLTRGASPAIVDAPPESR